MPRSPRHLTRVLAALAGVLFVYGAVLQHNDPDPLLWMTMYAAAAICCFATVAARPLPRWVPACVGVSAALWALWLATAVFGGDVSPMFPGQEATGLVLVDTEEGREMGGLAIIAAAMAALASPRRE